jgi:hypothetical protein
MDHHSQAVSGCGIAAYWASRHPSEGVSDRNTYCAGGNGAQVISEY